MKHLSAILLAVVLVMLAVCAQAEYGFIDHQGNVVVAPQYDYAYSFVEGTARVFTGTLKNGRPDEGLYGFIDETGAMVIPQIYENASFFHLGAAMVKKDGRYFLIDESGTQITARDYDYISYPNVKHLHFVGYDGALSQYGTPQTGVYYAIAPGGEELFSLRCESLTDYGSFFLAKVGGLYAVIGLDGKPMTDFVYKSLSACSEDRLAFRDGDLYGFMDTRGNVLIPAQYQAVGAFRDGAAVVRKDGRFHLIDEAGSVIRTYDVDYMDTSFTQGCTYAFRGTLNSYGSPDQGEYFLINIQGEQLTRGYDKGNCYSVDEAGFWRVQEGRGWYVVDLNGAELIGPVECDFLYSIGDGFVASRGERWALLSASGEYLSDYSYHDLSYSHFPLLSVDLEQVAADFRKANWGMTEAEVIALEGREPEYRGGISDGSGTYIGFDTTVDGSGAIAAYYFNRKGLFQGTYLYTGPLTGYEYMDLYDRIVSRVAGRLGDPLYNIDEWDTPAHESSFADIKWLGMQLGYLARNAYFWNIDKGVTVTVDLYANDGGITLIVSEKKLGLSD